MNTFAVVRVGLCATLLLVALAAGASAQITTRDRYASLVIDARTGNVMNQANADEPRHPASLTKMMTLYLLFEAMRDGRMTLGTPIRFSAEAVSRPPTKLGVPAGGSISAESAILGLITRSANDVAAAVGEALAGDEDAFARMMTQRARSIGMTRTTFRNASGLPDPEQVTTVRDMVTLGRRLIQDFPDRYHYFSTTHFAHGNRLIRNHNGMLRDYPGADGIKTGFINASGFNIVTSAQRDGVRLVGAVLGGASWVQRNDHMAELLDEGFGRLGVRPVSPMAGGAVERVVAARDAAPGTATSGTATPRTAGLGNASPRRPLMVRVAHAGARPAGNLGARTAAARPAARQASAVPARNARLTTARGAPRPPAVESRSRARQAAAPTRTAVARAQRVTTPQRQVRTAQPALRAPSRAPVRSTEAPVPSRQVLARAPGG